MPRYLTGVVFTVFLAALLLGGIRHADASVVVTVDKSAQRLTVEVDGLQRYHWPVSTARWGYQTPNGSYRPQRLERQWFSRKYDWSPMPHSIFFDGGYAIHGSYEVSRLGRAASHGCIRLHPRNAAVLFALVQARRSDTVIVVRGAGPPSADVSRREQPGYSRYRFEDWSGRPSRDFEGIFAPGAYPRDGYGRQRWDYVR